MSAAVSNSTSGVARRPSSSAAFFRFRLASTSVSISAITFQLLENCERIATFFPSAACHANSIRRAQFAPHILGRDALLEQLLIQLNGSANFFGRLVHELDAKRSHSARKCIGNDFGRTLRDGVEQR